MTIDLLWFRDRSGFWCVRVNGAKVIRTPETCLVTALEMYRWRIAEAAGEWSDL